MIKSGLFKLLDLSANSCYLIKRYRVKFILGERVHAFYILRKIWNQKRNLCLVFQNNEQKEKNRNTLIKNTCQIDMY